MTEQEAITYTVDGVELSAGRLENGSLLIARADEPPSYSNLAVEIRPNPGAGATTYSSSGEWPWFKLFDYPMGASRPAFINADTLEKAVERAETRLVDTARKQAEADTMATLRSLSPPEAGELLHNQIAQWLEKKQVENQSACNNP